MDIGFYTMDDIVMAVTKGLIEDPGRFSLPGIAVVIKIMVPSWVLSITRHVVFRGPRRGP